MLAFVLRRLLVAVPLLLLVSLVTFAAMRGMGGSPFELESGGVPAALQYRFEQYYALDRPWIFEWANYLRHIVTLDFGPSLTNRYLTVDQVMEDALPRTGQLALLAACWAVPIGIALGLVAAVRRQTWVDAVATGAATLLMVAPVFLFASLLSSYAVGEWGLVPGGWDTWQAKVLPSLVLGLAPAGMIARLIRAAAVETLEQDYVRTARAKGLTAVADPDRARAAQLGRAVPLGRGADARAHPERRVLRRGRVRDRRRGEPVPERREAPRLPDRHGPHDRARPRRDHGQPRRGRHRRLDRPEAAGAALVSDAAVAEALPDPGQDEVAPIGVWRAAFRRFREQRLAVAAAGVLAAIVLACLLVPPFWPYGATEIDFSHQLELPSGEHWLGTDFFGRDLVARMTVGGRASLLIAVVVTLIILVVGFLYGAVSGLAGGRVDEAMMRTLDGLFAIPRLPVQVILLVLAGGTGSAWTLIVALSILSWMTTARLVRGQVTSLKQREFVRAARSVGASQRHVLRRHILPNTAGVLVVAVFIELPTVILGEAYISVLGLGLDAPAPSWGNIAYDGFGLDRPGTSLATAARYGLSRSSLARDPPEHRHRHRRAVRELRGGRPAGRLRPAPRPPPTSAARGLRGLVRTLQRSVAGGR